MVADGSSVVESMVCSSKVGPIVESVVWSANAVSVSKSDEESGVISDSASADSHIGIVWSPKVGVVLGPSAYGGKVWVAGEVSSLTGTSGGASG